MKNFILGVVATLLISAIVIASGMYYLYQRGSEIRAEKESKFEQVKRDATAKFGTTCDDASTKISKFVYDELKPRLADLEDEQKDNRELNASLSAALAKRAEYVTYCRLHMPYTTTDTRDHEKLPRLRSGLTAINTYLNASRLEACDRTCRNSLIRTAMSELPQLEKALIAD